MIGDGRQRALPQRLGLSIVPEPVQHDRDGMIVLGLGDREEALAADRPAEDLVALQARSASQQMQSLARVTVVDSEES